MNANFKLMLIRNNFYSAESILAVDREHLQYRVSFPLVWNSSIMVFLYRPSTVAASRIMETGG